jgi:16S rRNA G966 N2-methylase RsmD
MRQRHAARNGTRRRPAVAAKPGDIKSRQRQSGHREYPAWLAQSGTPHDIVFVDPPFRKGMLEET